MGEKFAKSYGIIQKHNNESIKTREKKTLRKRELNNFSSLRLIRKFRLCFRAQSFFMNARKKYAPVLRATKECETTLKFLCIKMLHSSCVSLLIAKLLSA